MKRITPTAVMQRIARHEPIVFVDARNPRDWADSEEMIPGSVRMTPDEVETRADELPKGRPIIAYCT